MKIHSSVLGIALRACVFPSSTASAFLHVRPRPSTPSSFRGLRPDKNEPRKDTNPGASRSRLAYYPSDEPLAERLRDPGAKVIREGIGYFTDALDAAERLAEDSAEAAEAGANDVLDQGAAEDYLLKPFVEGMVETGKLLAKEMMEVRREFDELKASKMVEESTEDVARVVVLVEKDLEKVLEQLAFSLQEAEKVVQSAVAAMTSIEGLTDTAQRELSEKLNNAGADVEESIVVANSVAETAKHIAAEDQRVMTDLANTGERLSSAIDATRSLAQRLEGAEGGAAVDAVSSAVDQAASIVREDLAAAERIADEVGRRAAGDAAAVLALDARAEGAVAALEAARSAIDGGRGDGAAAAAIAALTKDAAEIRGDEDAAKHLAAAISKDARNDDDAVGVLERSSSEVNSLLDAVKSAVDRAAAVTADEASTGSVVEVVDEIEKKKIELENSISKFEKAMVETEKTKAKPAPSDVDKGEGGAVVEMKDGPTQEQSRAEISSSSEVADEKVGPLAHTKLSGNDAIKESPQGNTILTNSANDVNNLEHDAVDVDSAAPAVASANHHGHERLMDALSDTTVGTAHVEITTNSIGGDHFTDTAVTSSDFHTLLASAGSAVSEFGESIMSPSHAMHDVATSTTEALSEVVAVVSWLFSS